MILIHSVYYRVSGTRAGNSLGFALSYVFAIIDSERKNLALTRDLKTASKLKCHKMLLCFTYTEK